MLLRVARDPVHADEDGRARSGLRRHVPVPGEPGIARRGLPADEFVPKGVLKAYTERKQQIAAGETH